MPNAADYVFELQCDLERAQVSGIEPRQAKPGEEVVLSGNAFYGVTHVKFGRTLAQAIVESGERLVVRVPRGARTVPITLLNAQDVEIETDFSFTFESTPEPELHAVPTLSWWGLMLLFSALTGSVGLRLRSKGQAGV
ncbi:IPT/TIG domain-containing protein [Ottowia caeni]|uniref:IPT/TIG domain-containing protein n=1 Tax=Ottowia caeni TaxID=2870339 RepID=UPI003D75EFF5